VTRAAVATSMVIVFIVFPHYLIWRFENLAASRNALVLKLATPAAPDHQDNLVPRRIVPAVQKYFHIRVSSSEVRVSSSKVRVSSSEAVTPCACHDEGSDQIMDH
jgi:hypothetical protein